jgi:glutathionyl-hydroquinone reductase
MGMLVNGAWFDDDSPAGGGGQFLRPDSMFRDRVSRDGSSGLRPRPAATSWSPRPHAPGRTAPC